MSIKRIIFGFIIISTTVAVLFAVSCGFIQYIDDAPDSLSLTESDMQDTNTDNISEIEPTTEQPTERVLVINTKFNDLLQLNKHVVGEIKIDNTIINFPVLFNGDNDYYLHHDFYGREDKYGSIFMDMTNHGAILSKNTILHGHNFGDGRIFGELEKFKQKEFFENNKTIIFNNLYSDMEWEIFAVYVIHEIDYFVQSSFSSDEEFFAFIERIKSISLLWRDYTPSADDYILSLNTCSFEYDKAHTIIHAKLAKKTDNWGN